MYSEFKNVFSLTLYLQHVGVNPQGLEDECERTPALAQTNFQCRPQPHAGRRCLDPPLPDNATNSHQALGKLTDLHASKSANSSDLVNCQAVTSMLWWRICCALAL